ncbi:MAG: succinylglutamate desuccinylase/aspartoacylase family protein [Ectothiorhodospiraceae bacterium]|nr:succinylglutamate desuccinylase/aspartoacylase family protein [Chromatiales bacterium]MCP5153477.1 succinylglutamate desuccinylase/aspartoacylase family protein [Ectothiorhodospiraceae bacterium]
MTASAPALEFSFHRHSGSAAGPTVLVIGGIQGDEPGGFNAASLLVTHYRVRRGALWVVPNLNFESIVRRTRGVHGDLNRKFPEVAASDPDFERLERIKSIIIDPTVDYVLNLHDGSGFYRPRHIDGTRGPHRWGQSIIIDQERMDGGRHRDLGGLAREILDAVNARVVEPEHRLHLKNTRTREGDREMAKTLTYFAINRAKAAVGLEASKSLPTHLRVYYHLLAIEGYLARLGIEVERRFPLEPTAVRAIVDNNVQVRFYGDRIYLDLADARRTLRYVPLQKGAEVRFQASSPLVAILPDAQGRYRVSYGNRRMTELHVEPFDYDWSRTTLAMSVDGMLREVALGQAVTVREVFTVRPMDGYRVNVIGLPGAGRRDEAGREVRHADLLERYSVDRGGTSYRVELYRGARFAGMVLVRFDPDGELAAAASRSRGVPPTLASNDFVSEDTTW